MSIIQEKTGSSVLGRGALIREFLHISILPFPSFISLPTLLLTFLDQE